MRAELANVAAARVGAAHRPGVLDEWITDKQTPNHSISDASTQRCGAQANT
jgi:hypothetical protein